MNFTLKQQIRILKSPKKYLIYLNHYKLIFTNDLSIHIKKDTEDFQIFLLEDLKKEMLDLDVHSSKIMDLNKKIEVLSDPIQNANWQNAKFILSDLKE